MPSVPLSFREVKEPVDSGRPYLKSLTREKREEKEKLESAKAERREKVMPKNKIRQEKSSKSSSWDMVPGHMGIQYY